MKGWVLTENDKFVFSSDNSIHIFKSKEAVLDYYGGALGELNNVVKVEVQRK